MLGCELLFIAAYNGEMGCNSSADQSGKVSPTWCSLRGGELREESGRVEYRPGCCRECANEWAVREQMMGCHRRNYCLGMSSRSAGESCWCDPGKICFVNTRSDEEQNVTYSCRFQNKWCKYTDIRHTNLSNIVYSEGFFFLDLTDKEMRLEYR